MDTQEIFTGNRQEFLRHSGLTDQEIYNLITKGKQNIRWNSKRWGIYNDTLNIFSCDMEFIRPKMQEVVCEHCGKESSPGNYKRWHGANCKTINPQKHSHATEHIRNLRSLRNIPTI